MIELRNILIGTEEKPAIKIPHFEINKGDVIGVIGPSDSGKTSLLRAITMLDLFMKGDVLFDGEIVTTSKRDQAIARRKIGYVSQTLDLFTNYTVIENVMMPQIDLLGRSKQEAYDNSVAILKRLGLSKKLFTWPLKLSASEMQRTAIARAVCMDTDILVFDEPTAMLDRSSRKEVEAIIRELVKNGATIIFVTNSITFAKSICNRIVYVDENTIYEEGPAKEFFANPKRVKTRSFIEASSLLEIQIDDIDFDFYGITSRIDTYITDRSASKRAAISLNYAFEELAKGILLPKLSGDEKFRLNIIYSYSNESHCFIVTFKYSGDYYNPEDSDDDLALMILRHSSKEIKYEKIDEGDYKNKVVLVIEN